MQPWQYIVLLGAVVLVWAFAAPRRGKKPSAESASRDSGLEQMENALEQFMEDMEESNRNLGELVKSSREQGQAEARLREQRIEELEKQCRLLQEAVAASAVSAQAEADGAAPMQQEEAARPLEAPESIRARFRQLFDLERQGRSVDQIAKELGIHKGEVLLIQQLARQEESANAR
ncbi:MULTISPECIES: hypothetical protein [unclassified Paenibacillus]|uniref:hypothetical protein n=1 Tax=unclassified Paenibacillus TaxID=185978 RepID=UPI0009564993|nr:MULTISPECIES: hypothetical protein [unclassified Paenibacillus]ASS65690.1 hypothetical protein CIC07_05705 [Paenibacillus sp. RUD330]SIQ27191.1 hypothetical protein SAMN05880555_1220 [Paenibacillus sp. RU4X]SIQ49369.1 hypothetical protein SAMN05880570_1219 [Paenibacillus sp. RU4T]